MCRESKPDLAHPASTLQCIRAYPTGEYKNEILERLLRGETTIMSKKQKGFSLIELLIVVAIILIIAAIAIPNLLRSRMAANEASAVGSVRTIVTAQITYNSTYGTGFANGLTVLGGGVGCVASAATACLIDPVLSAAAISQKSGYNFSSVAAGGAGTVLSPFTTFGLEAYPISVSTGTRGFCSDESGVVRYNLNGAAIGTTDVACQAIALVLQ
jgi:type IV pilus assembly protein PilA